ncbi:MAG: thiolase domain-containing protein [Candidatus Bathyarchaeia archaeon]
MRGVSIIGVGMTQFGIQKEKSLRELAVEACQEAFDDAGVSPSDIEEFFLGNFASGMLTGQETIAPIIANAIGLGIIPCTRVEGACASSGIALRQGHQLVASGLKDLVLVAGVEKMTAASTGKVTEALACAGDRDMEGKCGLTFPGFYALMMRKHMHNFGTTREQIAMVSVKNRRNGAKNPKAHFRKEVAVQEVLKSKLIADPIRLFDCCPISDGASAAILCPLDKAKRHNDTPIRVKGIAQTIGKNAAYEYNDITTFHATVEAARLARKMAKINTSNIDLVELHDCFSIAEIGDSEDLGFFKKGQGGKAVEEGLTEIDGKIPINPSGGRISKGHPVGATGIGQVYDVALQLRREAPNQVKNAEIGMTHNLGASASVCTVTVLGLK